jgi:circadian clock protein KaiC
MSIGHLLSIVRAGVLERGVKTVIIDSLSGYLTARADQDHLLSRIQDLLAFLAEHEVYTFILLAQHRQGALGLVEPAHVSFLADAVVLFRTFEHTGTVRHGIAVYKKRYGRHERTIRELLLGDGAVRIGEPLSEFSGLLSGTAEFHGDRSELL